MSCDSTKCPKCGGRFSGPGYRGGIDEHLLYVCTTCGYQEKRPTLDAAKRNEEFLERVDGILKRMSEKFPVAEVEKKVAETIQETPNLNIQPGCVGFCPSHTRIC